MSKQVVTLDYSNICNPYGNMLPKHLMDKANAEYRAQLASVFVPSANKCFLNVNVAMLNKFGYTHAAFTKISLLEAEKQPIGDYEPLVETAFLEEYEVPEVAYIRIDGILFPDLTEHSLILPCRLKTTLDAPYSRIAVWVDTDAEKVFLSTDKTYNLNWLTEVPVKFGTEGNDEWNDNVVIEIPEEAAAA